jgi:hypothetical protein
MTRYLPEPRLREIDDHTGLTVMQYDKMAPGVLFCDVVVVKARFGFDAKGLKREISPAPLNMADLQRNDKDPLGSSLSQAGDLILGKTGTDIVLQGHVRQGRLSKHWNVDVAVRKQPQDEKTLAQLHCSVTGPRVWEHRFVKGWKMSDPKPTQSVPIAYELAYGGRKPDKNKDPKDWDCHEANPSGSGYSFAGLSVADTPAAPQWGPPVGLFSALSAQQLFGLGPIARFWSSRKKFAGTYDQAWHQKLQDNQNNRAFIPDYANDFDMRFFQCAHPNLQTAKPLLGDEWLVLNGIFDWQAAWAPPIRLQLPCLGVAASFKFPGKRKLEQVRLLLDTVTVDTDKHHVDLVWRLSLAQSHGIERVRLDLGGL